MAVSNVVLAQPGEHQEPPPIPNSKQIEGMVSDLSDELSLSEEQASKISKMYEAHFSEVKEKIEASRPERKEMEAMKTVFIKQVKAILTDEQQKLFLDFMKKNEKKHDKGDRPERN